MAKQDYLFNTVDWHSVERNQRDTMLQSIGTFDADAFAKKSDDELVSYFVEKFTITAPSIERENLTVSQREVKIDVSQDRTRYFSDGSGPHFIAGTEITVEIPFTGESEGFKIQPTAYSMNPPRAGIHGKMVIFKIQGVSLNSDSVRQQIDATTTSIEDYLKTLHANIAGLNNQLPNDARRAVETRRTKLQSNIDIVASLGFKVKGS